MKIILLGPPGCGKGTQSEVLCARFGVPQISTGKILRQEAAGDSAASCELRELMESGRLVPDQLIVDIVKCRLQEPDAVNGYLLDGFPRTIAQAQALIDADVRIDFVIEITLDDQIIVRRLSGRRYHPGSDRVYHLDYAPPKQEGRDDLTGEPLEQRNDDRAETVRARLDVYHQETAPLSNFYQSAKGPESAHYLRIDGNATIDEVASRIERVLDGNLS